jgi:invasion protein IalB
MTRANYRARLSALTAKYGAALAAIAFVGMFSEALAQTPAAPNPAPSVSSEPQVTTATYADWILRCQRAGDGPQAQRQCEVAQSVQDQRVTILQIGFARANAKQPFQLVVIQLVVILPVNVSFPSAVRVSVNDKDASSVELKWRNCTAIGCVAEANITDDILRQWRAQTERGRVQIKDASGRDVTIPFSFRGLAQALDALAKG